MKQVGQIVIFKFPQTNIEYKKPRPALLLAKLPGPYDDWLISMISSQVHQCIMGMDEIIEPGSLDFKESGLKIKSVIRVSRLAVVSGDILEGSIGEISKERFIRIRENLSHWIRTGKVNATLVDEN
ncbi:MAG: type II toxin-antitoxin system PemK/MazF family toxin [Acidobacteria bacterium]|jgi:mRNA interferase MazF|nr:type II toxin-antitoxin system PemK/MazF family toxin [Acidobacteriota bacterium]